MGTWKSTVFTGYAGGTADYPTLALDRNAVYIGTNNFSSASGTCSPGTSFCGTTLNVIPINSLFNAVSPTTAGIKQFATPYDNTPGATNTDRGFAIQGVNSDAVSTTGKVVTASLFIEDSLGYNVNGLTPTMRRLPGIATDGCLAKPGEPKELSFR